MGLRHFQVNLNDLSHESYLRFNVHLTWFKFTKASIDTYSFKQLFDIIDRKSLNIDDLDEIKYAEISNVTKDGNVNPVLLKPNERDDFNDNYFKKIYSGDIIKPSPGDILISSVRPNLKKHRYIESHDNCYYTKAFIQLRPKFCSKILYYLLRTIFHESLVSISRQGKGYPTLKLNDLYQLRFDKKLIDEAIAKENELINQILPHEKDIEEIHLKVKKSSDIIDEVFNREFKFKIEEFNRLKAISEYHLSLETIAKNKDLRFSFKFHRDAGILVTKSLEANSTKKIKNYLSLPITLGKGISPGDFVEFGNYYYISMADIKDWYFDSENAKAISDEYYTANSDKINLVRDKTICKDDILMARSGEGTIGKVALIQDNDIEGIFSDFTMRIRLKEYNPLFAYYYFRTNFFQYLIYINKKGLGNNTNIFPNQIAEFPILNVSKNKEQQILDEISNALEEQNKIESRIAKHREKIEHIIITNLGSHS